MPKLIVLFRSAQSARAFKPAFLLSRSQRFAVRQSSTMTEANPIDATTRSTSIRIERGSTNSRSTRNRPRRKRWRALSAFASYQTDRFRSVDGIRNPKNRFGGTHRNMRGNDNKTSMGPIASIGSLYAGVRGVMLPIRSASDVLPLSENHVHSPSPPPATTDSRKTPMSAGTNFLASLHGFADQRDALCTAASAEQRNTAPSAGNNPGSVAARPYTPL
jgi:hypothetical protein